MASILPERDLTTLFDAYRGETNLAAFIERALACAIEWFGAERATLFLKDDLARGFVLAGQAGAADHIPTHTMLREGEGIAGTAIRHGRPVLIAHGELSDGGSAVVVPLMALSAGAASVASDRERGMLAYTLAQPVSRTEVLLGKFAGLSGALFACITLGLGVCGLIIAWKGLRSSPASMIWLAGLSFLLALGMLSVGLLISTLARKASVAVGTAIFVWLALVFVSDLALMAGAIAMRLRIEQLFALALANPLQVFKMWSLHAVDASLDVIGPAGLYATEEYGRTLHAIFAACLVAWIVVPLTLAAIRLSRSSPL